MDLKATTKEAAIDEMIARLEQQNIINDKKIYREAILKREEQSSTGLGDGIAMPHAKTKAVNQATVLFAKSQNGVDFEALDGQPTNFFFMIAAPEGANDTHLQALASLSRLLLNPEFIESLNNASTPDEVLALFNQSGDEEKSDTKAQASEDNKPFVVAVTACPTGIAHTYMAEEALIRKAKEMNVDIRVETNGSEGAKNPLTDDEIKRAAGVIIAADKNVEMARFDGKHVIHESVTAGIKRSEELINKAIKQDAPVFTAEKSESKKDENNNTKSTVWSKIYKDLMNGVSHMLPFVVGGGILLAISFLFENILGSDSEIFQFLNGIGGNAFNFLIPILAGYIAMSIADRPGLMPGIVGGLMAVNSNAGFIGGLAAGFLAGYLIIFLKKVFRNLPKTLEGLKPILIYPVLGLLLTGGLMYFIVGPIFSTVNTAMLDFLGNLGTGNAVILGIVLGGMMAIDMGGPFNKAAYTFAIGIFTDTGDGSFMAAVMVAGMIPPIAIALATTFFKNKFTEDERKSGLSNYVLGFSFITEGAIPFAATDPLRVITSSIVGAGIAGGLTQLWSTAIPAPHGGIFVIPLAENALFFLLALVIGSVISGLMLGVWRKPVRQ